MSKSRSLKETRASYKQKVCFLRQSQTKYLKQSREDQQNCTGQEKLDIYFFTFLDCYCQILLFGKRARHLSLLKFKLLSSLD